MKFMANLFIGIVIDTTYHAHQSTTEASFWFMPETNIDSKKGHNFQVNTKTN